MNSNATVPDLPAFEPAAPFGENAVLQRQTRVPVWGVAEPGAVITVGLRGETAGTTADDSGHWRVRIPTGGAGGPFDLRISTNGTPERAIVRKVWVGEVWLAGGQSNMWWSVRNSVDSEQHQAAAGEFPVHYWEANGYEGEGTQDWRIAAPGGIGDWASVAYHFARRLSRELGVPVGIIHTAVPGKAVQTFMSPELIESQFPYERLAWNWDQQHLEEVRRPQYEQELAAWEAAGEPPGKKPKPPKGIQEPSYLWSRNLAPVVPYRVRGFIWWQGENGAGQFLAYRTLFAGMIQDWRTRFEVIDAPFYFAELHNAWGEQDGVQEAAWPAQREAQRTAALLLHNVYPVNTLDVSDPGSDPKYPNEVHPANKPKVGKRMAVRALHEVYGRDGAVWASPRITGAEFTGNGRVILQVWQAGEGLSTRDGEPGKGFFLAGPDRQWHRAEVILEGDTITLSSPEVPVPIAVRHAWANNPAHNVVNSLGLPLGSWRSDDWQLRSGG